MSLSQNAQTIVTGLVNAIKGQISSHYNITGNSSTKGHVQAGGVPRSIGDSLSAGTDNGYYARADHVHTCSYNNLTDKPSSFIPSSHTHSISNITNLQSTLNDKADEEHTHSQEDVSFIGSRETWQGLGNNKNVGEALDYLMFLIEKNTFDIDKVYPIGAIYTSVDSTSPSTLFGGTWQRLEDTFLYATSGNADTNSTTATAGSKDAVVVSHTHTFIDGGNALSIGTNTAQTTSGFATGNLWNGTNKRTTNIKSTGEDGTDKNMPPYMKVYMWKRTA